MSKLKYLSVFIAASGATAIALGIIIGVKGAIAGEGAKSWISGLSLMVGGVGLQLQAIALDRLTTQFEEQIDRTLDERLIPTPCSCCRYFHGVVYNGVTLNCTIHPSGWQGDKCPDWQTFKKSLEEQENDVNSR
jgi:hypothetical protein